MVLLYEVVCVTKLALRTSLLWGMQLAQHHHTSTANVHAIEPHSTGGGVCSGVACSMVCSNCGVRSCVWVEG